MIHIKIYGCEPNIADKIRRQIASEFDRRKIGWKCDLYLTEEELLELGDDDKKEVELIFLDIDTLQDAGLQLGKKLKAERRNRGVVFVSGHEHLVFTVQECFPLYFLRKDKIIEEMSNIAEQFVGRFGDQELCFFYPVGAERHCVLTDQILYIAYCAHKITITLINGQEQVFRGSVRECEEQLQHTTFFKANSGTLVNLKYCEKFHGDGFLMEDGEKILVSRERRKQAKERFTAYWKQ